MVDPQSLSLWCEVLCSESQRRHVRSWIFVVVVMCGFGSYDCYGPWSVRFDRMKFHSSDDCPLVAVWMRHRSPLAESEKTSSVFVHEAREATRDMCTEKHEEDDDSGNHHGPLVSVPP